MRGMMISETKAAYAVDPMKPNCPASCCYTDLIATLLARLQHNYPQFLPREQLRRDWCDSDVFSLAAVGLLRAAG